MKLHIHIDGGSRGNPGPAAAGVVIADERGRPVLEAGYFLGQKTNNQAEYEALLRALDHAAEMGATATLIHSDSELLVRQINGDYKVRHANLAPLFEAALRKLGRFERWTVRHVRREQNRRADALANRAMDAAEDVIEVSSSLSAAGGAVKRSRVDAVVVARCIRAPAPDTCPAGCAGGESWRFDTALPGGLCVDAAMELLPAVRLLRRNPASAPTRVTCPRTGCQAEFTLEFE